jgi:hypothetical protein
VNPKQVLEDFVRVLEAREGEVGELLSTARRMADSLQGLKAAVSRVLPAVSAVRAPTPEPRFALVGAGAAPEPIAQHEPAGGSLAHAIRDYLAARRGPTDCTLPELFRALPNTEPLTLGAFHDCLRELCADGALALHHWTGPLYAMPEPQFALMIGHGVAYYASLRAQESGVRSQESARAGAPG